MSDKKKQIRNIEIILIIILGVIVGINFIDPFRDSFQSFFSQNLGQDSIFNPGIGDTSPVEEKEEPVKTSISVSNQCDLDFECEWMITNCCTENAGASWECANPQRSQITCGQLVCPQVISPKPTVSCSCVQGTCAG